jgi:ribosomal RNA methyltransferase Nop2
MLENVEKKKHEQKMKFEKKKFFEKRILHLTQILKNYENFEWSSSKIYYFNLLKKEISNFFNYSMDLVKRFLEIIPLNEIIEFFESNEKSRPLTIRLNTIKLNEKKIYRVLEKRGIKLFSDPKFSYFGAFIKKNNLKFGTNPEFLAGYFTLQGLSSVFPIFSLNPKRNQKILDLAAAPGGKSTCISQIMGNSGILVANDKSKIRTKSLVSTIHRLGIENSIITNFDGSIFPQKMKGFDKVLLDAPCTGSGIISHDNQIKIRKINSALLINSTLQKRLLLAAIDSLKKNYKKDTFLVYSTCSLLVEENECIIQYALEKRDIKIIPTGLNFGLPGFSKYKNIIFNSKMNHSKRFFPHIHNIDGFFICKVQKN